MMNDATKMTEWLLSLQLSRPGHPRGNLFNILHTLRNAPEWKDVLAYDEFAARVVTKNPPPWSAANVEKWTDDHDTRACVWFQQQGIHGAVGVVGRGIQAVAREKPFHPVRDYLHALNWDGVPRLDTWLTRYLGVEDSSYGRAVGTRFLISAVARVEQPGCKADQVLILEGPQGILKSSALQALADPWFTDRISNLGGKDAAMEVAGVWLVEMSELDALTKASNSAIKSFVSRDSDRFRPPYGKHVVDHPRQCVFAGTINPVDGYLKDPTGARRFWPVVCGHIDLDALARDRDQLWAEALVRFQAGMRWWLETPELEALAKPEQEARYEVDAWTQKVVQWLAGRTDASVGEVLTGALGLARESWSQTVQHRVAKILVDSGFERYRPGRAEQPRTPRYRREAADRSDRRKSSSGKKPDWKTMTTVTVITRIRRKHRPPADRSERAR
jgi:predicted P-loop ATPase